MNRTMQGEFKTCTTERVEGARVRHTEDCPSAHAFAVILALGPSCIDTCTCSTPVVRDACCPYSTRACNELEEGFHSTFANTGILEGIGVVRKCVCQGPAATSSYGQCNGCDAPFTAQKDMIRVGGIGVIYIILFKHRPDVRAIIAALLDINSMTVLNCPHRHIDIDSIRASRFTSHQAVAIHI